MVTKAESKRSKGFLAIAGAAMAWGAAYSQPQLSQATVIFSDNLSSSTLQTNSVTPTATSTNYTVMAGKNDIVSINPGDLMVQMPKTSGGTSEVQAVFTTAPITVPNIAGDYIDLQIVFTNTAGILNQFSTASAQPFGIGLYNSGGVAPINVVAGPNVPSYDSILGSTLVNANTGGVRGWQGYLSSLQSTGETKTSPKIVTRPAQTASTDNNAQDLIGNGNSSTQNFDNPAGTGLTGANAGSGGSGNGYATLTDSDQYTDELEILSTGTGTYTVTNNLYTGSGTGGTLLTSTSATDAVSLFTGIDSLGIGWIDKSNGAAVGADADLSATAPSSPGGTQLDINSVTVAVSPDLAPAVPEPVSFSLIGISGLALMLRRRKA